MIRLKPGKEKSLIKRHPWVFSGAIEESVISPPPGSLVRVESSEGVPYGSGYFNENSQIRVRMLSWNPDESVDHSFFRERIRAAFSRRKERGLQAAGRLLFSEADLLPGLIVDRYANWIVIQAQTWGIDARIEELIPIIREEAERLFPVSGIVERSDERTRKLEGLELRKRILLGTESEASAVDIEEHGIRYRVDLWSGHKTGCYLDQRENRGIFQSRMERGARVLNCFSYTGSFSLLASQGGASSILSIDSSVPALTRFSEHIQMNGFDPSLFRTIEGNVFELLRDLKNAGERFDWIILDPPKLAYTKAEIDKGCRGYKDLNRLAFELAAPGGYLMTFSCSGLVSRDLFQKVVFGASIDAQREGQIIRTLDQAEDHPVLLTVPETSYLKGFLIRVL